MASLKVLHLLLFSLFSTIIIVRAHTRHLLHQPFFPVSNGFAPPPSRSPSVAPQPLPQPRSQPQNLQPKFPFSYNLPNNPQSTFFPSFSAPPPPPLPPSPTVLATFPANISSIVFPHYQSSSGLSHKRLFVWLSVSLSLLFSAILAGISVYILYTRHRREDGEVIKTPRKKPSKGSETVRLYPSNTLPSDSPPYNGQLPKILPRSGVPSTSSSEFLYLGTLANPHSPDYPQKLSTLTNNAGLKGSTFPPTSSSLPQTIGSPDLTPLPPLPKTSYEAMYRSGEMLININAKEYVVQQQEKKDDLGCPEQIKVAFGQQFRDDAGSIINENFSSSFPSSNNISPSNSPSHASISSHGATYLDDKPREDKTRSVSVEKENLSASVASSSVLSLSLPPSPRENDTGVAWSPDNSSSPKITSIHIEMQGSVTSFLPNQSPVPESIPEPPPPPPPPLNRIWENLAENDLSFERPWFQQDAALHSGDPGRVKEQVAADVNEEVLKPKLKPLHWDKVKASSDRAMVWDQIKANSFQLNEEMIETLFMVNNAKLSQKDNTKRQQGSSSCESHLLDPRKSQNMAILLRALNVTIDEVCEALQEGNCDTLGAELLENLKKMAPTYEEECKLREIKDGSPSKLGPAEKFLKTVVDIPFAFKRIDALIYIANFDSEIEYLKKSFSTLEAASAELRNSRMFLKLLEAVLKTGNRMNIGTNRGDAQAFRLDTLLKLVDIKGADGKTTLLHFVVQEIIRSEGLRICEDSAESSEQNGLHDDVRLRKLGLQVVSGLSGELSNVKKAAAMDSDALRCEVVSLAGGMGAVREVLKLNEEMAMAGSRNFSESMMRFLNKAAEDIIKIQAQERGAASLVKEITEYFHGNSAKEEAHPLRIFMIVRDFVAILDRVCKEVGKINERTIYSGTRPVEFSVNTMNL